MRSPWSASVAVGSQVVGGADTGEFVAEDPCTAEPDQFPGGGLDAAVQRIALSALNGAACDLGTTRERLVLSLDPNSSFDDVTWDRDTMEEALRNDSHRAIDDANDRDAIPGWVAAALGFVVDPRPSIGSSSVSRSPVGERATFESRTPRNDVARARTFHGR